MDYPPARPLARSHDAKLTGVCGGLAEWLDLDPTALRIVWAVATFFTGCFPMGLLYVVLYVVMPGPDDPVAVTDTWRLSRRNCMIAGVCGGLADWLGWSPTSVRVLYVIASICSVGFPGTLVYILLWIVLPRADQ